MTLADFVAMLTSGASTVLPWVGVGVGAAVALFFLYLGIRKAFEFFHAVIMDGHMPTKGGAMSGYDARENAAYHEDW